MNVGVKKPDQKAELARAKKADLVTLPPAIVGTNCANCRFVRQGQDYCDHPEVDQPLPDGATRMCCKEWDATGTGRAWKKVGVRMAAQPGPPPVGVKKHTATLYIVRHAHTALNKDDKGSPDRIRGWRDVPLDAEGREEAKQIAAKVARLHPEHVYSSDLSRAVDVAREILKAAGLGEKDLTTDRNFRPWDAGEMTGKVVDVKRLKRHYEHPDEKVPGGESFGDFTRRYLAALKGLMDDVARRGEVAMLVAHYRNLKTAEAYFAGGQTGELPEEVLLQDDRPPGSVLKFVCDGSKWSDAGLQDTGVNHATH